MWKLEGVISVDAEGSSKYKGVHWHKINKKWRAAISAGDNKIHLGMFTSELEAAKCYDLAAEKLYGEFARLNLAVPLKKVNE